MIINENIESRYRDIITTANKRWEGRAPEWKDLWWAGIQRKASGFLELWDSLKELERKHNIDVWPTASKLRYQVAFEYGRRLGSQYKRDEWRLMDLYEAYFSQYEGPCEIEYLEFSDRRVLMWFYDDPYTEALKKMGKKEEELKEMADLFAIWDYGVVSGFNPSQEFDVFHQRRLIMRGDSHSTYLIEDNRVRTYE